MGISEGDFAMKRFAFTLLLVLLVLFSDSAFGWTISGNSVFEEDSQAKITVTPHTSSSPVNQFNQQFEL